MRILKAVVVGMMVMGVVHACEAATGSLDWVSGWYRAGTNFTVTATADDYSVFSSWSGDTSGCTITNNKITIVVDQPRTVTAAFAIEQFTLQIVSAYGSPDPVVGSHDYAYGTLLTNSVASPVAEGSTTQHVCTGWAMTGNEPASGGAASMTMTLTNDTTLTWNWQTQYWLDTVAGANGTVDKADQWVNSGGDVVITATPDTGYHFTSWSGDTTGCTINGSEITAAMTVTRQITASFAINTYTVTFVEGAHGSRTGGGALVQTIDYGSAATAPTITPDAGWAFTGWDVSFNNITANLTVTAQYSQNTYTLQIVTEHGTGLPVAGLYTNFYGTAMTNMIIDSPVELSGTTQYVCTGWVMTGNEPFSGTATNCAMTVTNDAVLTWQWQTNYWIQLNTTGN